MKSVFTLLCFIVVLNVNAQNGNPDTIPDTANAVIIHKDPRLDLLVKKQAEVNKVTGVDNRKTDKGYRILVISTNNREEALKAKTKIYTYFPDLKAYLWYQSPYFRVKAGNFKDKQTADKYKNRLSVYFPNGVFVMKDIIEQKKGKGLNDEKED
ncbi:MAG TPA: SPOR domain-containing protein [Chitinophagaceae bacterium]|nr:SPOR domain-containing protein [Chitinophagaceae bacterium]